VVSNGGPRLSVKLSVVAVFSALIALSTVLSIPLPQPLGELTWAPPIYLALSVLAGSEVGFWSTGIGSFIGESLNIPLKGFPPIYALGIVWARAPEALIVGWARKKSRRTLVAAMVLATLFETLAFFFPDWLFYSKGLFYGSQNEGLVPGFWAASFDLLTMVDLVFIPAALLIIQRARPEFTRLGFA